MGRRTPLTAAMAEHWDDLLTREASSLDLSAEDGYWAFRLRVLDATRHVRLDLLADLVEHYGVAEPDRSRPGLVKALVDGYIASHATGR